MKSTPRFSLFNGVGLFVCLFVFALIHFCYVLFCRLSEIHGSLGGLGQAEKKGEKGDIVWISFIL